MNITKDGALTLLYNNKWPFFVNKFLKIQGEDIAIVEFGEEEMTGEEEEEKEGKAKKEHKDEKPQEIIETLCQLDFSLEKSNAVHSLSILHDLFIDGKAEFIMKVCI